VSADLVEAKVFDYVQPGRWDTVLLFGAELPDGRTVTVGIDHRPGRWLVAALDALHGTAASPLEIGVPVEVEAWQICGTW
jgi:hypothetical protein